MGSCRESAGPVSLQTLTGENKNKQTGKMALFEKSWETLDKARNEDMYETQKLVDGTEVTFLKSGVNQDDKKEDTKQGFSKEEEENIAKAAEKMNDRDD